MARSFLLLVVVLFLAGCCCQPRGCPVPAGELAHTPRVVDASGDGPPTPAAELPRPATPEAREHALRGRLERTKLAGVAWKDMPFLEAVAYLRTVTGFNLFVTPAARAGGADDLRITYRATVVDADDLLTDLTRPNAMRWTVRDEIILIQSTSEKDHDVVVQIHAISDLVGAGGKPFASAQAAIDAIRAEVAPLYWRDEHHVIRAQGEGTLIVKASDALQDAVAAFLDGKRGDAR